MDSPQGSTHVVVGDEKHNGMMSLLQPTILCSVVVVLGVIRDFCNH